MRYENNNHVNNHSNSLSYLFENPYVKFAYRAAVAAFFIGGAIYKFESKMDEIGNRLVKKIDEHIISDRYEKQAIRTEYTTETSLLKENVKELRETVKDLQEDLKEYSYTSKEFIRPTEPRRKHVDGDKDVN